MQQAPAQKREHGDERLAEGVGLAFELVEIAGDQEGELIGLPKSLKRCSMARSRVPLVSVR